MYYLQQNLTTELLAHSKLVYLAELLVVMTDGLSIGARNVPRVHGHSA